MLSLLAQGNTGSEILQILDTLIEDNQQSIAYTEPTADSIEFWSVTVRGGVDTLSRYVLKSDIPWIAVIVRVVYIVLRAMRYKKPKLP